MTGNITYDVVALAVAVASCALVCWLTIEWRVDKAVKNVERTFGTQTERIEKQLAARADEIIIARKDLADYKLAAAREFATYQHMKDMEIRLAQDMAQLTGEFGRLTNRVEQLPTVIIEQVARIINAKPGRRG